MNKLSLFILILSMGLFACGEANTDQNGTADGEEQKTQTAQQKDRSVEEIINHKIEKLDEKLSLSPETQSQIKAIYTNAYLAEGGSLDDRINREDISDLRIKIVTQTKNEVMPLLDENQRETYDQVFEER